MRDLTKPWKSGESNTIAEENPLPDWYFPEYMSNAALRQQQESKRLLVTAPEFIPLMSFNPDLKAELNYTFLRRLSFRLAVLNAGAPPFKLERAACVLNPYAPSFLGNSRAKKLMTSAPCFEPAISSKLTPHTLQSSSRTLEVKMNADADSFIASKREVQLDVSAKPFCLAPAELSASSPCFVPNPSTRSQRDPEKNWRTLKAVTCKDQLTAESIEFVPSWDR